MPIAENGQKETLLDASAACDSITQNQKKVLIYIYGET
jgi:hypothetical protein